MLYLANPTPSDFTSFASEALFAWRFPWRRLFFCDSDKSTVIGGNEDVTLSRLRFLWERGSSAGGLSRHPHAQRVLLLPSLLSGAKFPS